MATKQASISAAHTPADVDRFLEVTEEFFRDPSKI
jgi:hypothetical protein